MNNFNFHVTTDIRFGKDRLGELPEALAQFGKKVLLVYGGGSIKKNGLYDRVTTLLSEQGFDMWELAGVEPNPRVQTVKRGADLCKEHGIDVVLPIGGGSTIDCGKAVAAFALSGMDDPWELVLGRRGYTGPALPIVTILTLAATGSEMNVGAVISNPETKQKLGFGGPSMLPSVSFLDPTNTFSVNHYQTAAGSADILSHLMENYFSRVTGVDVQNRITEGLMRATIANIRIALKTPADYDARANLMWASTLALNGLTGAGKGGAWSCHPMEHELSAFYDITHGVGLAILTPRWMAHVLNEETVFQFATYAREVWGITETVPELAAKMGIQKLYDFFKECQIPMTLPEVGIKDERDFEAMAQQAIDHSSIATAAFVPLQKADVLAIYQACMTASQFV